LDEKKKRLGKSQKAAFIQSRNHSVTILPTVTQRLSKVF
jgi:hypothetical protein